VLTYFAEYEVYLLTCQKHDVKITEALELLFQGKMLEFMSDLLDTR
jgi:hypothetical protein